AESGFVAVVYNPLAQRRSGYVDVPISWPQVLVTDDDGNPVESQILPFRHRGVLPSGAAIISDTTGGGNSSGEGGSSRGGSSGGGGGGGGGRGGGGGGSSVGTQRG
ncbi:unnamed protein product, partial [Laminaria digitata]